VENAPLIGISSWSRAPGADAEAFKRYLKWQAEVYHPLVLKSSECVGTDNYQIVRINPEYPARASIMHALQKFKGLESPGRVSRIVRYHAGTKVVDRTRRNGLYTGADL
jgi:hypothetical protein